MLDGSDFKFAMTGGAAGTMVDNNYLDVPINYASSQKGVSLGAGAFLICDQSVSPVALLRNLLHFFNLENCGKCTPCRVGTWRSLEILEQMSAGKGHSGNIEELLTLAENMATASFCGLGQSVAIPMKSALQNFAVEFSQAENQNR
jgi:NADH:ubiquinone oxidoreductase subunit F (NADH-binding)